MLWDAVLREDVGNEQCGKILRCNHGVGWDEDCLLQEAVNYDKDGVVAGG